MYKYTKEMRKSGKNFIIGGTMSVIALTSYAGIAEAQTIDKTQNNVRQERVHFKTPPTEIQKKALEEARDQFKLGNKEKAEQIIKEAGLEGKFLKNHFKKVVLTDTQKQAIINAKAQMKAGDKTGAKVTLKNAGLPENGFRQGWFKGKRV